MVKLLDARVDSRLPDMGYQNKAQLALTVDGLPDVRGYYDADCYLGGPPPPPANFSFPGTYHWYTPEGLERELGRRSRSGEGKRELAGQYIWAVHTASLARSLQGGTVTSIEVAGLVKYAFYYADKCFNFPSSGHYGALGLLLPGGNHLGNGFTSSCAFFNTTEILDQHLKEVTIYEQEGSYPGTGVAGWNIGVSLARHLVESYTGPSGRQWVLLQRDGELSSGIQYDIEPV